MCEYFVVFGNRFPSKITLTGVERGIKIKINESKKHVNSECSYFVITHKTSVTWYLLGKGSNGNCKSIIYVPACLKRFTVHRSINHLRASGPAWLWRYNGVIMTVWPGQGSYSELLWKQMGPSLYKGPVVGLGCCCMWLCGRMCNTV